MSKFWWLNIAVVLLNPFSIVAMSTYSNVTLVSRDGDLSVVVYLPLGVKPGERAFYYSSRFDHSSMIGSITRKRRYKDDKGKERVEEHILYGTDVWRQPHNSNWPESGVGLAAEFGVGDNGAFCLFMCGWGQANNMINGVLGYEEAKLGEPFLKIGVGELVKGTCPACDSAEEYKFSSPYLFSKQPRWTMIQPDSNTVILEHEAVLNDNGYKLVKEIHLTGNVLTAKTSLTNLGKAFFSTAWYSHNFFTCDGVAVGPGYAVDLYIDGDRDSLYDEPGTWSWSTPLKSFAKVIKKSDYIRVVMDRALEPGIRIKAEFVPDGETKGAFSLHACDTSIYTSIPELDDAGSGFSMYGYNLYVERGTFSPEPQIVISLHPGQESTWTQRLVIEDKPRRKGDASITAAAVTVGSMASVRSVQSALNGNGAAAFIIMFAFSAALVVTVRWTGRRNRRRLYEVLDAAGE